MMVENTLVVLFVIGTVYLLTGGVLALWLQVRGLGLIDPANAHGNWAYRLCITPGLVLLWPVFFTMILRLRMVSGQAPPDFPLNPGRLRQLQGWAVLLLLVVLPVLAAAVLARRVSDHREAPVQQLNLPAEPR